ncbi:hypothetical protein [Saccharomonospora cyanea]|uniref:Uncharacterized protein n=1 Tax=Saccharomonospora cyanea NA-134 TaxID=882082 RepID=H5XEB4_9PSEU|nr:hypothetical protein [Saccharomonospora cyanea]EHR61382.1 hypothetical protein SaccyDRAFT_2517 [Saccharomonospora cyanea NA-134]
METPGSTSSLGLDQTAALKAHAGIETLFDPPVCVCHAVCLGGHRTVTTHDTRLDNLQLYPEAILRRAERGRPKWNEALYWP